jgi:hypothetical protein
MKTAIVVAGVLMFGCTPPHQPQKWSTKGCSEAQAKAIGVAVEWWNADSRAFFGADSIEMIQGETERQLICVTDDKDEEAIRMREIGFVGWARGNQILILDTTIRPLGDFLANVIAHEFGHQLGLGHLSDESAVMYHVCHRSNGLTNYDLEAFHALDGPAE